jgi:hypothetical protein
MLDSIQATMQQDREWIELRERVAKAARELHFLAFSSPSTKCAAVLAIARNFAELAMSIPPRPEALHGVVDGSTSDSDSIPRRDPPEPRAKRIPRAVQRTRRKQAERFFNLLPPSE